MASLSKTKMKNTALLQWQKFQNHNVSFRSLGPFLLVFFLGIVTGRITYREPKILKGRKHGLVLHVDNEKFINTSHVDRKTGRPILKKQLLEPFRIPNLSGFQIAYLKPGQEVENHIHKSMHEVFYILSGKGTFNIQGLLYPATAGTVFHLAPGERHSIYAGENSKDGDLVMAYFGVTVEEDH